MLLMLFLATGDRPGGEESLWAPGVEVKKSWGDADWRVQMLHSALVGCALVLL